MSATEAASPDLEALTLELRDDYHQIEDVRSQLQQLMFGVDDPGFLWRPGPNRWSISECLAHLNVTAIDRRLSRFPPIPATL